MAIKGQAINVTLTAIDASTGKRKTGDSANISVYLVKDGTAAARNDATAISETDATNCPGEYTVELDATDMNANTIVVTGKSSTANIEIVPVKIVTEVGKIADISGRLPDALVDGNIKANTQVIADNAITTASLDAGAVTEIVLGLLKYDFTGINGEAQRSLLNAARSLVNKIAMVDNTLTIYKEDDSTPAFTAAVTGDANVSPIVTIDPA